MAGSLLVPISVTAKVITKPGIMVPALKGDPFTQTVPLETGIHVHWALPDALTRARTLPESEGGRTIFPGVPDLWLVVRLDPVPEVPPAKFKRTWRGWVVNSRTQSKPLSLAQFVAPDTQKLDTHTVVGLLPSAAGLGYPGWGLWPIGKTEADFDPAMAAYYPAARQRFGLHDADVLPKTGNVTYVAIGWYSDPVHDPLFNSPDRPAQLERWKFARHARPNILYEVSTLVPYVAPPPAAGTAPARPTIVIPTIAPWKPASLRSSPVASPSAAVVRDLVRQTERGGTHARIGAAVTQLQMKMGQPPVSTGVLSQVTPSGLGKPSGPSEIVCHGAVVEVPLAGFPAAPNLAPDSVRLYPSASRAMAVIATQQETGEDIEFVEMMLNNLDQQKDTSAGVIDMPGAAHARTFQSMPGKSQWYARIEVWPPEVSGTMPTSIILFTPEPQQGRIRTAAWPAMTTRSAQNSRKPGIAKAPPQSVRDIEPPAPSGPTAYQIQAFIEDVGTHFTQAQEAARHPAKGPGKEIDPRLVRVQDYRPHAQPTSMGHSADGSGPNEAGWWLDVSDPVALEEFFRGAAGTRIVMPNASSLYELPGPRWYRPWSPQIVLYNALRSNRFGEDGRFEPDGFVRCRYSGETVTGLGIGPGPIATARDALAGGASLTTTPGLPPEASALVEEALLMDSDSGRALASHVSGVGAPTGRKLQSAIRAVWLNRTPQTGPASRAVQAVKLAGGEPSPIAITPWTDPLDPLFVDVSYAYSPRPMTPAWELLPDHVDMALAVPAPPQPPAVVTRFTERARLTSSLVKVLDSALVTCETLDVQGHPMPAQTPPGNITADQFKSVDILSAPLTRFDQKIFDGKGRERAGAMRINHLRVIDVYGIARTWNSCVAETAPIGDADLKYCTALTPRLPYWARLQFRLQAAAALETDASATAPSVCGFLLPDFIEHSLEVFDGDGRALGQLVSDRPQSGSTPGVLTNTQLKVRFDPHPWVANANDPIEKVVTNPVLQSVVSGIASQHTDVPPGKPVGQTPSDEPRPWFETGLTAMLRVIDTIRGTMDPTVKTHDSKVRLLGEPIVVLRTQVRLEATATADLSVGTPPPLAGDPALPLVRVRIGDATRPDDGVLGCFLPATPESPARFAPVSKEAAEKAVLNGLAHGISGTKDKVTHPFIKDLVSEFDIPFHKTTPITVLADPRGGLYATCGVLPRKKITIPREQLDAGMRVLEATFRAGPVLGLPVKNNLIPAVPSIDIPGYQTEFVRRTPDGNAFTETLVRESVPVGELPLDRVVLTEGWLRVYQPKDQTPA